MRARHGVWILATCVLLAVACGRQDTNTQNTNTKEATATPTAAQSDQDASQAYDKTAQKTADAAIPAGTTEAATGTPPDNSGVNARDANGNTVTAGDQSNKPEDVSTTQQIRKALVADKSLSINAHNIKIITRDGQVTLRGPVNSTREKAIIEQKAAEIAGQNHVQNELEVTG